MVLATILFSGGVPGLPYVSSSSRGGLFLSLVIGVCAFVFALPSGIVLARGRESKGPVIHMICGAWVESWRSVTTLFVLVVAVSVMPPVPLAWRGGRVRFTSSCHGR